MSDAWIDRALGHIWHSVPVAETYAVVDGARHPAIVPLVRASGLPHRCLYAGALAPDVARVAPWLVQLTRDAPLARTLVERGFGDAWAVYARTTATFVQVHRHLRRLLRVRDAAGNHYLFRFYDPRVLRVFLPACTPDELAAVFGPLERLVVEGEEGDALAAYGRGDAGLSREVWRFERRLPWLGGYLRARRGAGDART